MSKIDSVGVFIGEVVESGLATTKNGFPQWVARIKAEKKFVEEKSELDHFQMTDPGYVDWSSFGEDILAYLVLFKSNEVFDEKTALLNYEQLKIATGWDGTDFDPMCDGTFVGKKILFRVEHNSYTNPETGKTTEGLQVNWIDSADAPPQRQLKTLDAAGVKDLAKKLKIRKSTAPAKPAAIVKPLSSATKPQTAPAAPAAPAPAATPAPAPAAPATPASAPKRAKMPKTETAESAAPPATEKLSLPTETTQGEAWDLVCRSKGGNEDSVIEEAWIAACGEVGGDRDEDAFTDADWAKVRNIVIRDLSLDVK